MRSKWYAWEISILVIFFSLSWFCLVCTYGDIESLSVCIVITGFNSYRQLQFHILCLWLRHCYGLWCWCIPISPLRAVTSYGSYKVHVLWQTTCTRWKQSLVHHILCIFMDCIHNCWVLSDCWSNEERIPHQVQTYDICRELDLWLSTERSVYFGSSLHGALHDSECILLHVLHKIDEPSCQKDQHDNPYCWYDWSCMRNNSSLMKLICARPVRLY